MERAPTLRPLSRMQAAVCDLLGLGLSYGMIAEQLEIAVDMVKQHTKRAAAKIPGDLPAQARCATWARGASLDVLQGLTLRFEITQRVTVQRAKQKRPLCGGVVQTASSV